MQPFLLENIFYNQHKPNLILPVKSKIYYRGKTGCYEILVFIFLTLFPFSPYGANSR